MKIFRNQSGQGMTEYIIIVALIAYAAIAAFSYFGQTVRTQTAAMSDSLAGEAEAAKTERGEAAKVAGKGEDAAAKQVDLKNYTDQNK